MRHGVFQLPSAAFLLSACGLDYFLDQKTKVARAEQTDRRTNVIVRVIMRRGMQRWRAAATRDIRAQKRGVSGDDEMKLAKASLPKKLFAELRDLVREARDLAAGGTLVHHAALCGAHEGGLGGL
jgi:hypothetical protein